MPPRRVLTRLIIAAAMLAGLSLPVALGGPASGNTVAGSTANTASSGSRTAAKSPVTVTITALDPSIARPGSKVRVRGTIRNASSSALSGVIVQLRSSAGPLRNRDSLRLYAAGNDPAADAPVQGARARIRGTLRPGQTRHWTAVLRVNAVHMTEFGVYPLSAQATDALGTDLGASWTFLPYWPSAKSHLRPRRDDVAWLWPLIDNPVQGPCPGLLNNHLAASMSSGGRLDGLLSAGASAAGQAARLTWVIDPALLTSAQAMTRHYQVGADISCHGAKSLPRSAAAAAWLSRLKSAVSGQSTLLTPYADADIAALTRANLEGDLHQAFNVGRAAADEILGLNPGKHGVHNHGAQNPASVLAGAAWPAQGQASYPMLQTLAVVDGIKTVVLSSSAMQPKDSLLTYTPSAVTHTLNGQGGEMRVLLADATITKVLGQPDAKSAAPGAELRTRQRVLAETAMIASQAPHLSRAIVIAPPRRWDPSASLASALLQETDNAPWLAPARAGALAADRHAPGQVARHQPGNAGPHRFTKFMARSLRATEHGVQLAQSLRVAPSKQLYWAVAGIESAAWRDPRGPHHPAKSMLRRVTAYVGRQVRGVSIIGNGHDTLGGQKGPVPVTIHNQHDYPVRVRIRLHIDQVSGSGFSVVTGPGVSPAGPGTVVTSVIQVPPKGVSTKKLQIKATTLGSTTIDMWLLTPRGQLLPGRKATMSVQATHFGTFALVILAAALGVFMITSAGRAIRRGRTSGPATEDQVNGSAPPGDDSTGAAEHEQPEETDNVVHDRARSEAGGTDEVLTEDADDYARVPGWAQGR